MNNIIYGDKNHKIRHQTINQLKKLHIDVKGKQGKNDGRIFENVLPVPLLPGFACGIQSGIAISPVK